jgi:SlyX protein
MMNDLQEQIIDLQTRVAYQEDSLAQLNQVITRQDTDIIQLRQQVRLLAKKIEESLYSSESGELDIAAERPPHY